MSARYVYILSSSLPAKGVFKFLYISAWASALLVQTTMGMQEPQGVGRVTSTDSRAFFIYRYRNYNFKHKNHPVRESAEGHRLTRQAASV